MSNRTTEKGSVKMRKLLLCLLLVFVLLAVAACDNFADNFILNDLQTSGGQTTSGGTAHQNEPDIADSKDAQKLQELQNSLDAVTVSANESKSLAEELQGVIDTLQRLLATQSSASQSDSEQINQLKTTISELTGRIAELEKKISGLERTIAELQKTIDEMQKIMDIDKDIIFKKVFGAKKEIADLIDFSDIDNSEQLQCLKAIMDAGAFTKELTAKYSAYYTADASSPYIALTGSHGEYYQIYINDDNTVFYISQIFSYRKTSDSESRQLTRHFDPIFCSECGRIEGFYLRFNALSIKVEMPDGRFMDCSVYASYYLEEKTSGVWNGEKQIHENVTYLSECFVSPDVNNAYAYGDGGMFERVIMFTEQSGDWDLVKAWEYYREFVLTPVENRLPTNQQKVVVF